MRKKSLILTMAALVGAILLTACTSSDKPEQADKAGTNGTSSAVQTTGEQTAGVDTSAQKETSGQNVSGGATDQSAQSQPSSEQTAPQGDVSSDGAESGEAQNDANDTNDVPLIDSGAGSTTESSESQNGAGSDQTLQDIWSGTYKGEEETLSVTYLDEKSFSFSFAQAGISGTAQLSGTQAVYKGDDHHDVVFGISGDMVTVTVSSEEDYDASESPLNGTYVKES